MTITITLDTRDKFFAMLDAVQQFVDNCNDARLDESSAKLAAAEEIRDQLDAALALLAN